MFKRFTPPAHALRLLVAVLCLGTVLAGCASKEDRDSRSGSAELYEKARKAMDSGNYGNAIRYYEFLGARFPFSNETKQSQLDLIYCYYKDGQTESAVDAATTFERENPTHPRVDYALYMRGLAYFSGQHSWYHKLFNANLADRPPRNVQESFSALSQLVQRFPQSPYAEDARQRMVFLRNRLAEYENYVARYYLKRDAWLAAANRARYAVEQFEGSPAVAESLEIMVIAYERLGMTDVAENTRQVLAASYPERMAAVEKAERGPWYRFW